MESESFKNLFLTDWKSRYDTRFFSAQRVNFECSVWHETRKLTRTILLHKGGLSRVDFFGAVKVRGDTTAPSGLYARLCHAFLVWSSLILSIEVCVDQLCRDEGDNEDAMSVGSGGARCDYLSQENYLHFYITTSGKVSACLAESSGRLAPGGRLKSHLLADCLFTRITSTSGPNARKWVGENITIYRVAYVTTCLTCNQSNIIFV